MRTAARVLLAAAVTGAGVVHLTVGRRPMLVLVPRTVTRLTPLDADQIVLASGVAELGLGAALALAPARYRARVGRVVAAWFVAVLPGNVTQLVRHHDAFGLDSDRKRALRLLGQPLLIAWALWSTRTR